MQKAFYIAQNKDSCWLGCIDLKFSWHTLRRKNLVDLFGLHLNMSTCLAINCLKFTGERALAVGEILRSMNSSLIVCEIIF